MRVAIVGAGVMGLMLARELALQGIEVELLDKGVSAREASWAGGGIISPLYPWRYSDAVTQLAAWSQGYYPNLIESLEAESGIDPELSRHGLLMLSVADHSHALDWAADHRYWLESVPREQVYALEPGLQEGFGAALWMAQVASVRNPRLLKALHAIASLSKRIRLRECCELAPLSQAEGRVQALLTVSGERIEADQFVFCSGAWTQQLLPGFTLGIEPVKGQMLVFDAQPGTVHRIVLRDGKYVIPRRDGKVLAGSTLEYTGFEKQTTEQARNALADAAIDMFPALSDACITHHWAGLRPGSPKGIPAIGLLPGFDNVYVNAGHFRNGLVLAPASVHVISSLLTGRTPAFDVAVYRPDQSTPENFFNRSGVVGCEDI
jgi:glycine oxidase